MTIGEAVAEQDKGDPGVTVLAGTVISINWATQTAQVNVAGGTISADMIGIPPVPNDAVRVLIAGGRAVILGIASRAASGTVTTAPDSGLVLVHGEDGNDYSLPYGTGLSLTPGDVVLIDWSTGGIVSQEITGTVSAGAANPTPPAPKPKPPSTGGGSVTKTRTFNPTTSASKRRGGGWGQGVVYFGQSYSSAGFFYGAQIADSIPDDAELVSIRLYLEVTASSGVGYLTIGMHDQRVVPPGDLILSDAINFAGYTNGFRGWVDLSGGVFFDRLKKGLMFGISIKGPGYRRISGAPSSGAISISWKE